MACNGRQLLMQSVPAFAEGLICWVCKLTGARMAWHGGRIEDVCQPLMFERLLAVQVFNGVSSSCRWLRLATRVLCEGSPWTAPGGPVLRALLKWLNRGGGADSTARHAIFASDCTHAGGSAVCAVR